MIQSRLKRDKLLEAKEQAEFQTKNNRTLCARNLIGRSAYLKIEEDKTSFLINKAESPTHNIKGSFVLNELNLKMDTLIKDMEDLSKKYGERDIPVSTPPRDTFNEFLPIELEFYEKGNQREEALLHKKRSLYNPQKEERRGRYTHSTSERHFKQETDTFDPGHFISERKSVRGEVKRQQFQNLTDLNFKNTP